MGVNIPPNIVWSTDKIDTNDPFQRRWLLKQIILRGRVQDVRALDLREVKRELPHLDLPPPMNSLWRRFLESRDAG